MKFLSDLLTPERMVLLALAVIAGSVVLWAVASLTGWVKSPEYISHVSMFALVLAGLAMLAGGFADMRSPDE